jgi:plastocyanin
MLRQAFVVTLVAVLTAAAPVAAVENVTIDSIAGGFMPRTVTTSLGEVVTWSNDDGVSHTTSGRRPLAQWSRALPPGSDRDVAFRHTGGFPYLCTIHPEVTGKVRVPMIANRESVGVDEQIVLRVATNDAPGGFRYQIQRRRVGGAWKLWRTIGGETTQWRPRTGAAGEWQLRARTVRISSGARSGYGPALHIYVPT